MKRVLVISYYWPPSGGSGVQRWVKMCKYLPEYGWQPVVYTPSNPAFTAIDRTLASDVDGVEVLRSSILEPGQFARKTTGAQVTPINGQEKTLKQRVAMWIRGNCFIPDPRVTWVRPSVRFLLKWLKENHVDAIVSTGPPHSMHLIARRVSLKTGIPWVADFRDPWTKMFYFKHLSLTKRSEKKHEKLEKAVLDDATAVVAVSPLVQAEFKAMTSTPVKLVTNGFDQDDFATAQKQPDGKFTVTHAGLFAADGNPLTVWHTLGDMVREVPGFRESFRLCLCGKTDAPVKAAIAAAGLEPFLEDYGYVEHKRAVELMGQASVLLLPLRQEPEYKATLPGKLFEYLAARRPILGIGQKDGAMAMILSETGAGTVFDWNEDLAVAEWLKRSFGNFVSGTLDDNPADLSRFSRPALAAQYADILNEIISR